MSETRTTKGVPMTIGKIAQSKYELFSVWFEKGVELGNKIYKEQENEQQ